MSLNEITALADIGLVGLGVMGSSLGLNIAEKGFKVAVLNPTEDNTAAFVESAGSLQKMIIPCSRNEDLVRCTKTPRIILFMVTAGEPVDSLIGQFLPMLSKGDILIDGGNSYFGDTMRRSEALKEKGIEFIGLGVSGGSFGARHGPSLMAGASHEAYQRVAPILSSIAAKYGTETCSIRAGDNGAGHFVKMVHNGIEYADMQMIAEIYGILRDGLKLSANEMAPIFKKWNESSLSSYLIGITEEILRSNDAKTLEPIVDVILDSAEQKGTGKWATIEAQKSGVVTTTIEEAVAARNLSSQKKLRKSLSQVYSNVASKKAIEIGIKQLERALLAGRIVAYAQGFSLLSKASEQYQWDLQLKDIANVWREGCIIRSALLDGISQAFDDEPFLENLLLASSFVAQLTEALDDWRHVVSAAVQAGIPVPCLSAALNYFESLLSKRGVMNLVQAQRDFFGHHGFERIDEQGSFHGPWS